MVGKGSSSSHCRGGNEWIVIRGQSVGDGRGPGCTEMVYIFDIVPKSGQCNNSYMIAYLPTDLFKCLTILYCPEHLLSREALTILGPRPGSAKGELGPEPLSISFLLPIKQNESFQVPSSFAHDHAPSPALVLSLLISVFHTLTTFTSDPGVLYCLICLPPAWCRLVYLTVQQAF